MKKRDKNKKLGRRWKTKAKSKITQPTLPSLFNRKDAYGAEHLKQQTFDKNLKMLIYDGIPFKIADSEHFRKMVND